MSCSNSESGKLDFQKCNMHYQKSFCSWLNFIGSIFLQDACKHEFVMAFSMIVYFSDVSVFFRMLKIWTKQCSIHNCSKPKYFSFLELQIKQWIFLAAFVAIFHKWQIFGESLTAFFLYKRSLHDNDNYFCG